MVTGTMNQAQRLYDMIQGFIEYAEGGEYQSSYANSDEEPVRQIWDSACQARGKYLRNESDFLDSIMEILKLVVLCEQTIKQDYYLDEETGEIYLEAFGGAKALAFSIGRSEWGEFRSVYSDHFLIGLRLAAINMPSGSHEEVIQQPVLDGLQSDIEELTHRILLTDLNVEFKSVLIDGLQSIRQAILEYRLSGAVGISQALDRSIGSMVRHRDAFKDIPEGEETEVVSAFWKVVGRVDEVVSPALKIIPLAMQAYESIRHMLSGGD